jgi:H+-transporting ATPase
VLGTQVIALFISVYGAGADPNVVGIGWPRGLIVISISLATFVVIDLLKVAIIHVWDKFADQSKNEFVSVPTYMMAPKTSKAAKFIQKQKKETGYDERESMLG